VRKLSFRFYGLYTGTKSRDNQPIQPHLPTSNLPRYTDNAKLLLP
jgi:hypothetical protein